MMEQDINDRSLNYCRRKNAESRQQATEKDLDTTSVINNFYVPNNLHQKGNEKSYNECPI